RGDPNAEPDAALAASRRGRAAAACNGYLVNRPIVSSMHEPEEIERRIRGLGKWFHNIDLQGVKTAPDHFLGDYPAIKWQRFAHALPADLSGRTVLDIGCNAGFYAMAMKRRGAARVLGIDSDPDYLKQACFAAELSGLDIEFQELSVYDVARLGERFDLVLM